MGEEEDEGEERSFDFMEEWEAFYTEWYAGRGEARRGGGGGGRKEEEEGRGAAAAATEAERAHPQPTTATTTNNNNTTTTTTTNNLANSSSALTVLFPNRSIVHPNDTLALRKLAFHRGLWRSTMTPC